MLSRCLAAVVALATLGCSDAEPHPASASTQLALEGGLPGPILAVGSTRRRVTHRWRRIRHGAEGAPVVALARMQTARGSDPAQTRLRKASGRSFDVKIEEDRSRDREMRHSAERIGYVVARDGKHWLDEQGSSVAFATRLLASQPKPNAWHTEHTGVFEDGVVVAQVMSYQGPQPAHVRLRGVDLERGRFQYRIEEWDHSKGVHDQEDIAFLVMQGGVYRLANGLVVQVHSVPADHRWRYVPLTAGVVDVPIVLTQCQTANGPDPVVTRIRNVAPWGFELRLQEEQAKGKHTREMVGFVAIYEM